jgi:hypothetical protein
VEKKNLKAFPVRSEMKIFATSILEVLARAIRQVKEIRGMQIGKKEVKLSLYADNMSLY